MSNCTRHCSKHASKIGCCIRRACFDHPWDCADIWLRAKPFEPGALATEPPPCSACRCSMLHAHCDHWEQYTTVLRPSKGSWVTWMASGSLLTMYAIKSSWVLTAPPPGNTLQGNSAACTQRGTTAKGLRMRCARSTMCSVACTSAPACHIAASGTLIDLRNLCPGCHHSRPRDRRSLLHTGRTPLGSVAVVGYLLQGSHASARLSMCLHPCCVGGGQKSRPT